MTGRVLSRGRAVLVLLVALGILAACTVMDEPGRAEPAAPAAPPAVEEAPESGPDGAGDPVPEAVVALQKEAESASAEEDHERAAALLERALGIAPDNAVLWHNLAVVRYRQGEYRQAESMALRSVDYGHGLGALVRRNWELIAVTRELSGNNAGAAEARERLRRLETEQTSE